MFDHVIKKQQFKLKYKGTANAFELQRNAEAFCKEKLLPRIETMLETYNVAERLIVDKLKVDVKANGLQELDDALAEKIIRELKHDIDVTYRIEQPVNRDEVKAGKFITLLQSIALKTGINNEKLLEEFDLLFMQWVGDDNSYRKVELVKILQQRFSIERLVSIINDHQYWKLLQIAGDFSDVELDTVSADFGSFIKLASSKEKRAFQFALKIYLLKASAGAKNISEVALSINLQSTFVKAIIQTVDKVEFHSALFIELVEYAKLVDESIETAMPEVIRNLADSEMEFAKPGKEALYVANAGMVIVAAYLPKFFANIGLKMEHRREEARALSLLNFIATGKQEAQEFELVLAKVFLGIPVNKFVFMDHRVTDEEIIHAEELLQSVIEYWKALRNTSIDGLRYNFLQREGMMRWNGNSWQLKIGSQTHDILLDYLPWNIHTIKLPWMETLLEVEWK